MLLSFALAILSESATLQLQGQLLRVELAKRDQEQVRGLSGRTELSDGEGMLFVYPQPHFLSFWMKGMLIPISIGFFDEERILIGIKEMPLPKKQARRYQEYCSPLPALYALEVPSGWFERYNIAIGTPFEWVDPSSVRER